MKRSSGFTVIELIVVIVILLAASVVFFNQKAHIEAASRDNKRKTDINTVYHNLEKVYYAKNKSYPKDLNEKALPAVISDTFKDPDGIAINESRTEDLGATTTHSTYTYEPSDCEGDKCESYTLRADLENEADYVKKSAHNK
jgi:prepilin-type N-terminal cleavage/methylation domain-containing protein